MIELHQPASYLPVLENWIVVALHHLHLPLVSRHNFATDGILANRSRGRNSPPEYRYDCGADLIDFEPASSIGIVDGKKARRRGTRTCREVATSFQSNWGRALSIVLTVMNTG
jgi:hypothetical protein